MDTPLTPSQLAKALGSLGGKANTPAQQEQRRKAAKKAGKARWANHKAKSK